MSNVDFLRSLSFFDGMSENDMESLLAASKIRTYPKKSSIFIQGDSADRFFIVSKGRVKLHQTTMEGNEAVLALLGRGDSFGEAILIDGGIYTRNATTIEKSEVIELFAAPLKEIVTRNARFSLHLLQSMTRQVERLRLENEHLAVMSTTERAACLVLRTCLAEEGRLEKAKSKSFRFPYNKHLAATRLGMKPETFSRALKDLKKIGVTIEHSEIHVENREALKNHCCSNCSASPEHCPLVHFPHS